MRIFFNTLAFAPFRVFKACLDQVYATISNKLAVTHYVLNQHYPNANDGLINDYCKERGIKVFDVGRNIGLSEGYNYLNKQIGIQYEDIIVNIDPDVWPITPEWDQALIKVLSPNNFGLAVGIASLMTHFAERQKFDTSYDEIIVNDVLVTIPHTAIINSICAMPGHFLEKIMSDGGWRESNKYYGGFESVNFDRVKNFGYKWVYLNNFKEEFNEAVAPDQCYKEYKWEYAYKNSTDLDFETWLKNK